MYPWSSAVPEPPNHPPIPYPVAALLPQSGPMVLLDKVVEIGENHIIAELAVRADGLFAEAGQPVPAWVGLEYMAQTVAAFSGYHRRRQGLGVDLGFLLGTRHYQCSVDGFPSGARLRVRAEKILESANDMMIFDCTLEGESIHAESKLNLLLPRDSDSFLRGKGL